MATRGGRAAEASLKDSVDRLATAFDRLSDRIEAIESGGAVGSDADAFTRHIRRFMPFYALATIWALMLIILPTRQNGTDNTEQASQISDTPSQTSDVPTTTLGPEVSSAPTTSGPAAGPTTTEPEAGVPGPAVVATGFDPLGWNQTGKTKGNFDCKNGVRQIPWSSYSVPCYPKWTGNNGGATFPGVTGKEIVIVQRRFPETANSQAIEAANALAGIATADTTRAADKVLRDYMNKVYELWGRTVKWVEWESKFGDSTAELQSQGKEGACADANVIKNDLKAFAVFGGSNVFAECAAERKMMTFWAGAYFPERWYKKLHPYAWHSVMNCEMISNQLAEYIAKRLSGRPAKWAKGLEKGKPRKFGTYVPNNDEYQYCTDVTFKQLKDKYNVPTGSRYNYALDVSRFADEAARAMLQFKADGVTTVVMACDPISPTFMTQAAKAQAYFPEWFEIGAAALDADNYPRTWDGDEINGSLFGLSQLGATPKLLGPNSEAAKTYKAATGTSIAAGTTGDFQQLTFVYSALQAAGPNLTPNAVAEGIWRMPPGGAPDYPTGYSSYQDGPDGTKGAKDHTGIDDSREVWWNPNIKSFDGKNGAYVVTYGGKRFRNGEWPKEEPPVFK